MSVCIMIDNPSDMNFYLPVATERFFNQYWQTAIDKLNIKCLGNGVIISRAQLTLFLTELEQIRQWVFSNCSLRKNRNELDYMINRIDLVKDNVSILFDNPKIETIWMG